MSLFQPQPIPRPGPILGAYPERELSRLGGLERLADRVVGAIKGAFPRDARRYRRIIAKVERQRPALHALADEALKAEVLALRQRLRHAGLAKVPCLYAFALIREQSRRTLGLEPYTEQLLGGWAMLQGLLVEMQTGEGKTLAATLPAATAAMAGIPVQVVTVNDYLVQRDAAQMGPLYRSLGLSVGAVVEGMDHASRQAAYHCDICYCTNKQLVFDYLRDRMVRGGTGALRMRLDGLFGKRAIGRQLLLPGLCFAIVDEADSVLIDEARTPLIISGQGEDEPDPAIYRQALDIAAELQVASDFHIRPSERLIELTDAGCTAIATLANELPGVWASTRQREELVRQALFATHLLMRDRDYLVLDGKVQIIDAYTGRLMPDRNWERGLHQLVETKEGCDPTPRNETLARISYQRFFRRYLRLAGMSGTAREVAAELWTVYHLGLARVPTHRRLRRRIMPARVLANAEAKWTTIATEIGRLHQSGRPVLVGTVSVAASDLLSSRLQQANLPHRVLNARQDQDEAQIIAQAGQPGQITVATNMAGRGTDIQLGEGVAAQGGLHVIASERHDARRIDRQLFGRCARQGDPGSAQAILALDDNLIANASWRVLARIFTAGPAARLLLRLAQIGTERRHAKMRRQLLRLDEQLGRLLAFSGRVE
ncbi:MAG: preprotein translocase subunit SecA [Thiohalocapsa sp. PB-PSB1]|jgi:preprotein translocase subunit SecA|nr:MAG: hypothetical protein N838_18100 [Thiohalocapsa sp. PB-PSB1]QQO53545.1 MAG: preprotein translocase subunit SecA [Thiohalocapsa sp. PB-PSB1]HCS88563.1 prepilin peptidase [Chromatiaceae bacterium]